MSDSVEEEIMKTLEKGLKEKQTRRKQKHKKDLSRTVNSSMDVSELLSKRVKNQLMGMAKSFGVKNYTNYNKSELADELLDEIEGSLPEIVTDQLSENELSALGWLLDREGIAPFDKFSDKWGNDFGESRQWYHHPPNTLLGNLKLHGLVFVGTDPDSDQEVVLIPDQFRDRIQNLMQSVETSSS